MPHSRATTREAIRLVRRAAIFVHPYRRAILIIVALALLLAACNAAEPLILKFLFDALAAGRGLRALGQAVAALLALEAVRATLGRVIAMRTWDVRLNVDFDLRASLVAKLNALPIGYHQRERVGGTTQKLNQGITGYITAFTELAFSVLPTGLYLVLSAVAMVRLEWQLSLLMLAFVPLPALIVRRAAGEQTQRERQLNAQWTEIFSRFNEVLAGILTVKGFGMEEAEQRRFLAGVRHGHDIVRRGVRTDTRTSALQGSAATLARVAALAVGGYLIYRGQMTVGTLVAFLGYIAGLFGPVQGLTGVYQTLHKATASLELVFGILDADAVGDDARDARDVHPARGEVAFRAVSFDYEPGKPALRDVTLHVMPGETIALVGPSGSGKTTFAMLLQRFFPASGGSITIDGTDIREMTARSLRAQIGVVFQDVHLFDDTVHANIAYGRPDATRAEVEAAARAANADAFIRELPGGYDARIGERGGRLSGGQRQRLAIARAILKDPPILILDEATSALDAHAEAAVQDALRTLTRDRTTFVIAHRLSTVVSADRIVVLRDGTIAAVGAHAELLATDAYYASLFARGRESTLSSAA